jgi:hypothetical protein
LVVLCVVSLGGGGKGGGGGGGGGLFPTPHTNNTGGQKNADSGTSKTRNSVTFTFVDGDSSNSHSHGHSHGHGHGQQSHGQARRQSQSLRQSLGESGVGGDGADLHEQEQQEQHVHHIHHQEIGLHNAADITAAARLAAASVEALPDFDQTAAAKEAKLHLNPKRLLLDNPKSLHLFGELSEGEKVLALHKTFYHMEDSLSVSCCVFSLCFDFLFLVLSFCFAVFWQRICVFTLFIYMYICIWGSF